MEKLFVFVCTILFSASVSCQQAQAPVTNTPDTSDQKQLTTTSGEPIFTTVEREAEFIGGSHAWIRYLAENLDAATPFKNGAPAGNYPVMVKFIVLKTGKILDCEAVTAYGYGMEKAVIKLIKKGPKWMPAQQNGLPVNAYTYRTVRFMVEAR